MELKDSITNAIDDSCEPQIVPEIEPYTVEGKTVIVVTIAPESRRPYYLKSKGKENGTYIRVGATTRLASPEKIKELEMEGAKIDGLIRKESYELSVDAIREMIVNAHCHRNMTDESCVQVAIYDDRLEVTSPGGLYNGLTFEEALQGHSKLRNRAIANVFSQIGLIEAWGTGLQRIQKAAKEYGLAEPEFIEMPESFRVNLYRSPLPMQGIGQTSVEHRQNIGDESAESRSNFSIELNNTQRRIAEMLSEDSGMTGAVLAEQIGISKRNIETNIKKLKEYGVLIRHGSSKGGYWEVVK